MARAVQTTQKIVRTGLVPVLTEPTVDGDAIESGNVALMVVNSSGGSINVTVESTASQDGLDVIDLVVPVGAGATALIGPFPARTFAQPTGANESGGDDQGLVYVDYSAQLNIDRAVVAF